MIVFIFRGADVGAQDNKKYTPLMEAAAWRNTSAWENDVLFKRLINKDRAAMEKSIFLAVGLHEPTRLNTIKVSDSSGCLPGTIQYCCCCCLKMSCLQYAL